jgi:ABC-type multidrug transport system fused ATPase/permease subunit
MSSSFKYPFFVSIKRFLFPLWEAPIITFKTLVQYTLWGASPVVHIIFIQQIVSQFESGTQESFIDWMVFYIVYNIIYELLDFSMKKWSWVENINAYRNAIDKIYFPKFIKVSNTEVEKHGTGKLVSLITTGTDKWALSVDLLMLETFRILFVFLYGAYMFFQL